MGWGEDHTAAGASYEVTRAARDLADAVRTWLDRRTTGDEEKVEQALDVYESAVSRQP